MRITSNHDASLISWLSRTTLPMLDDAKAIPSASPRVELMPPMLVQAFDSNPMPSNWCAPRPSPLWFGPNTRPVAELCSTERLLPMPGLEIKHSVPLALPSLSLFNSVFVNDKLDPNWRPNDNSADEAASQTIQLLESKPGPRWSAPAVANAAPVPYENPLTWSVPNNAV